jgi:hypothetical protein
VDQGRLSSAIHSRKRSAALRSRWSVSDEQPARGTEALLLSVAASALLTVGSSAFNLHLIRHGVLTVGTDDSQSLVHDLRRLPVMMLGFASTMIIHRREPRSTAPPSARTR